MVAEMKNELSHSNTKGSHWYVNGPGKRWQAHAQYAMGQSNPNGENKIDSKTGFKLKSGETSVESDMYFTNPQRYDPNDPMRNCTACTTTFELRRRGYNVVVKKDHERDMMATHASVEECFPDARTIECGAVDDASIEKVSARARVGKNTRLSREVIWNLSKQGNGARGAIGTLYTTRSGYIMGHEMAYEVKKNKVHIYDAQSADEKNAFDTLRYCVGAYCTRLDNANFDIKKVKGVAK